MYEEGRKVYKFKFLILIMIFVMLEDLILGSIDNL